MSPVPSRLGQPRHGPGGGLYRFVAIAESTSNAFCALEIVEGPGGGTPLHCHSREEEFFYVIEGQLSLFVGDKTITLAPGQSAFAPRGIPHSFKNCSISPVKFLVVCTPPDIEPFFDYGSPLPSGDPPSDEQMMQRIKALAPKFGIQLLGPSPL